MPCIDTSHKPSANFDQWVATVLNLILRMEKKNFFSILKNAHFSGKGCQSLHNNYINVMRIRKMLIIFVMLNWIMHCIRLTTVCPQDMS